MKGRVLYITSFLWLIITLILGACHREVEQPHLEFNYDYYPLAVGSSWTYELDSIIYDPSPQGTAIDSSHWQVKEVVVDTFYDLTGVLFYRIERFERAADSLAWQIRQVYAQGRSEREAYRLVDNMQLIPLVFPIVKGSKWDGNRYIDPLQTVVVAGENLEMFKGWNYSCEALDESLSIGGLTFPQTLTVRMADSENLIELRSAVEQYARDIGLVYREYQILDTQCNVCCNGDLTACGPLPWVVKAERGFIIRQRLVAWE